MAILVKRISNTRPTGKSGAAFCTSTTNGSMMISRETMASQKLRIGDAVLIEAIEADSVNLAPTFEGGEDVFVFLKGFAADEKGEKSVGNKISDTNNKNVIGSALLYNQLKGNNNERNNFSFGEAIYGFLEMTDGTIVPITQDTPEDEGVVNAYTRTERVTESGKMIVNIELEEQKDWTVADAKENGIPFYPLTFLNSVPKLERKSKDGAPVAAKAAKAGKAAPAVDMDDDDEFN